MEVLKTSELLATDGGALKTSLIMTIFGAVVFIIGVIDGIFRPLKCRS